MVIDSFMYEEQKCLLPDRDPHIQYCRDDVKVLREVCLKFRHLLLSATGEKKTVINPRTGEPEDTWFGAIDPFQHLTIALVC